MASEDSPPDDFSPLKFTHACGHAGTRVFRGDAAAQARQRAAYEKKWSALPCRNCYRKSFEKEATAAAKTNAKAGHGRLSGTAKEILWAEQIRFGFSAVWKKLEAEMTEPEARDLVALFENALSWIRVRNMPPSALLTAFVLAEESFDGGRSFDEYTTTPLNEAASQDYVGKRATYVRSQAQWVLDSAPTMK